jgi:hypothetical protein
MLEALSGDLLFAKINRWTYLVHGRRAGFRRLARALPQTKLQTEVKRRAIRCHASQLMLSRRRFLAYAARRELLLALKAQPVTSDV